MSNKSVISTLIISIFFTACTDQKEANNQNFTNALNEYVKTGKHQLNCFHVGYNFPLIKNTFNEKSIEKSKQQGFLVESKAQVANTLLTQIKGSNPYGIGWRPPKEQEEKKYTEKTVYNLNSKAKKYYKDGYVCLGKAKINEVISFTEPITISSYKLTNVKFSYTIEDLPNWVNIEDNIKTKNIELYLKDNKWEHKSSSF